MVVPSSWLIGSFNLAANASVVVGGVARTIPAGDWYVRDADADHSLITKLQTEIAAEVPGATVYILQNRKVHIDFNGVSTTLTIPSTIAEQLGFTSSPYAGATSRTAEKVSTLLWSPGWPETTMNSPVGVAGRRHYDRLCTMSPTGMTFDVTVHHSQTLVDLSWRAVRSDRAWTAAEEPGEYNQFFNDVIIPGYLFKLYSGMLEDDSATTAVSWTTALGPYFVPEPEEDWYQRFVAMSDSLGANIELKAVVTGEYD